MSSNKKSSEKEILHIRNRHRAKYDFKVLIKTCPELAQFVRVNEHGGESIDFFNPKAVKTLNKALLKEFYDIKNWEIPNGYLCPPIPGRADYIHYMADVLASSNNELIPTGAKIKCLDIGIGANCVYPILGIKEYGWSFVGAEIDDIAIANASKIILGNKAIKGQIEVRKQTNIKETFKGIIKKNELFDLSICNPPFYKSLAEATASTTRKVNNLKKENESLVVSNFAGQKNELWCEGGEARFVEKMILQSKEFEKNIFWFSTLVSKQSYLKRPYELLTKLGATDVKTISVGQGNKISRILVWTFLNKEEQDNWRNKRWGN
jgi:23S rRNA (adenine1618-N6)-methyltransferase